jgi:L-seryl-tRNA(Ser) seleniumtransferase
MKLETSYGHRTVIEALRTETEALRSKLSDNSTNLTESEDAARTIERNVATNLSRSLAPSLQSVINATGVIVHTNLGRAPLANSAIERIVTVAAGYCNLEYNLADGDRGHRTIHASELLTRLTGAEAAAVVNNNAAALLLILTAMASGREVIISRGELVEIGGGFRIPDVMRQSGALLREVGTTNRTRPEDYAAAINDNTALILRIHPSNFRIEGFTERPSLRSISKIGHEFGIPVVEDLGGGNLYEADSHGTPLTEPTVQQSLEAGVTICCFSGDKLLGGPQAGLIVGRETFVRSISNHPLMRAVRADKLTYAALEATLLEHLSERADETIPVNRMIKTSIEQLRSRAHEIVSSVTALSKVEVQLTDGPATIGGGAAPGTTIHSCLLHISLSGLTATELEKRLRESNPPVIGRIDHERLLLDLRTVSPDQDQALTRVLVNL